MPVGALEVQPGREITMVMMMIAVVIEEVATIPHLQFKIQTKSLSHAFGGRVPAGVRVPLSV